MTSHLQDDTVWSQPWLHRVLLYISLVALLAFFYFTGAGIVRDRNITSAWQSVRGTVVAARPEVCGKFGYVARPHYHYSVGAVEYAGDERAAGTGTCGKLDEVERVAVELVGSPAEIYFNPSNPGESVLGRPQITPVRYIAFAVSIVFIIATILGLRRRFNTSRKVGMCSRYKSPA